MIAMIQLSLLLVVVMLMVVVLLLLVSMMTWSISSERVEAPGPPSSEALEASDSAM